MTYHDATGRQCRHLSLTISGGAQTEEREPPPARARQRAAPTYMHVQRIPVLYAVRDLGALEGWPEGHAHVAFTKGVRARLANAWHRDHAEGVAPTTRQQLDKLATALAVGSVHSCE